MAEAERRLDEVVRRFVSDYLAPFLGLLCNEGVGPREQRRRADGLVRALRAAEIRPQLCEEGRRIIVDIDEQTDPPDLTFNRHFVEDVEISEALGLLESPIDRLLGVKPFRVKLLLAIDDEDRLRSLVNRARRSGEVELARLANIPAVAELRIDDFRGRLECIAQQYGADVRFDEKSPRAVETVVASDADGWPSWNQIAESAFIEGHVDRLREAHSAEPSAPSAETTAEICWESLELSPRSAVRTAADRLRAEQSRPLDLGSSLRKFAAVFGEPGHDIPGAASEWDEFRELADRWRELFRSEQRLLAWSPVRRQTPELSVFERPLDTIGLDEPESLPWEVPLLCWSVRERRALCDLLEGRRSSIAAQYSGSRSVDLGIDDCTELSPLEETDRRPEFALRPAASAGFRETGEAERLVRGVRACYGRLFRNFCRIEPDEQRRLLQRIRSSYDGYFDGATPVWERRLDGWESLEAPRALRRLSREIEYVLGPATMLGVFDSPFDGDPRRVPCFVFVAPFGVDESISAGRVPLEALRASFEEVPALLRAVEVPDEPGNCCRWLGDRELRSRELAEMPAERLFESVRGDAIRLQVERE